MSPRFVLGRENVPCVAEVVNRSLKADCTDFNTVIILLRINLRREGTHPAGKSYISPVHTQQINMEKVVTW